VTFERAGHSRPALFRKRFSGLVEINKNNRIAPWIAAFGHSDPYSCFDTGYRYGAVHLLAIYSAGRLHIFKSKIFSLSSVVRETNFHILPEFAN
jgi:hypothetical protein